ncbi:MAG: hypothetical protein ABIC57_02530, partial [bacterium]
MKTTNWLLFCIVVLSLFLINTGYIQAQNMISGSGYEIIDPTISSGGDDDQISTSGNYLLR